MKSGKYLKCHQFPKQWARNINAACFCHALPGNVLDFNSLKSPFLSFWGILKNLTDFHKVVETAFDSHLREEVGGFVIAKAPLLILRNRWSVFEYDI